MSVATHNGRSPIILGPRLGTRVAAVAVMLALAALAAFTVFSGPTKVAVQAPAKVTPTLTTPPPTQTEPAGTTGDRGD